jgi:hypothetical protein
MSCFGHFWLLISDLIVCGWMQSTRRLELIENQANLRIGVSLQRLRRIKPGKELNQQTATSGLTSWYWVQK